MKILLLLTFSNPFFPPILGFVSRFELSNTDDDGDVVVVDGVYLFVAA